MKFNIVWLDELHCYKVSVPEYPGGDVVTIDELEAAEARAAQLEAERDDWKLNAQCAHIDLDDARRKLEQAQQELDSTKRVLNAAIDANEKLASNVLHLKHKAQL